MLLSTYKKEALMGTDLAPTSMTRPRRRLTRLVHLSLATLLAGGVALGPAGDALAITSPEPVTVSGNVFTWTTPWISNFVNVGQGNLMHICPTSVPVADCTFGPPPSPTLVSLGFATGTTTATICSTYGGRLVPGTTYHFRIVKRDDPNPETEIATGSFTLPADCGGSTPASTPDPRGATLALAAQQVTAAGVEGSSSAVRVRGTEVLPVTSRLSGAVGPRGGVALTSEGLEVRVASMLGARADAGVLVPSSGELEASVTGALVPGSVVEVWVRSQPRLVAAMEVPESGATTIVIPTGSPLDGGEPIEDGAHTLELRMFTADGYEIVATGITIGQLTPTGIPAGEGGLPLGSGLLVLLGAAGAALAVGRRMVVCD